MKIKKINEIDKVAWDEFVLSHPRGSFFQTRYYYDLYRDICNSIPIGYAAIENDKLVGVLVGVIYQNYIWPINFFTKRTVIIGGPLIADNRKDVFDFLIENFTKHESNNSIYIQFRNIWEIKIDEFNFEKFGFEYEEHLDIIHNLTEESQVIKQKISKGKRGNFHKSISKGTIIKEVVDLNDYKSGVDLIISTYKRIGLPCPTKDFFVNAYNQFSVSGYIKAFGAYVEDDIISMRIEICFKNMVYDWYTGDKAGFSNRYPNDILPYFILFWGKENGFEKFDFGGAGKPGVPYGVREHKMKFGGELVSYGRYEKVNNKLLMIFVKLGFFLFKRRKINMKQS